MDDRTRGQRYADNVAALLGSWRFIIAQTGFLALWITLNVIGIFPWKWDVYPFVFLNLMLSFQAAYSAPFIMMSQNRQSEIDRQRQIQDLEIDTLAEKEIKAIGTKVDKILAHLEESGNGQTNV